MKTTPVLYSLSLVSSLVIAWLVLRHPERNDPAANPVQSSLTSPRDSASSTTATSRDGSSPNPAALRDRLQSLGFSEEEIRSALRAELAAPRLAKQRAYLAQASEATPWWQRGAVAPNFTREQTRELRQMSYAEREELVRLFGPTGAVTPTEKESFAFLSPEKAVRLAALERDYADLCRDATDGGPGWLSAAGTEERIKLLATEHQRDLATLLSPEERFEVELRQSETGRGLSGRFEYFEATEAETRAIYALQKAWDEQFLPSSLAEMNRNQATRVEATKKLEEDLRNALGAERFADWQRGIRLDYRSLVDVQRRFNFPQPALVEAAKIPVRLSGAANRLIDNGVLDPGEKKAELTKLASEARAQIRTVLGAEIGDAYLRASGRMWVDILDRGAAYTFTPGGTSVRSIPNLPSPFASTAILPPRNR